VGWFGTKKAAGKEVCWDLFGSYQDSRRNLAKQKNGGDTLLWIVD